MPESTPVFLPHLAPPTPDLIARLAAIVGPAHALTDAAQQQPYLVEWRDRYIGRTPLVLRPGTTDEVSRILALCNAARVGVVPQSGNTGLVGGQIPYGTGSEIVLSVARLDRVREIDAAGGWMIAEAGVTLADVKSAAERADRLFPLSMASEAACRIGGNLATNAGGTAALAYGTARNLVAGLEVVLADGRIWSGLRTLKKDNTGYNLRDLVVGSEGTLGIITAAALRHYPRPRETVVAMAAIPRAADLLALFRLAEHVAGPALTAFEFLSATSLDFVRRHAHGSRVPALAPAPWYALVEISGMAEDGRAAATLEALLEAAMGAGLATDAALAVSPAQTHDLWAVREAVSEAQKPEGGSIKHDVSLPVERIPEFLDRAALVVERIAPGARPVPFGHFGDGNVHFNVSQPLGAGKAAFLDLWDPMQDAIHDLVADMGGSFSAEHGIGRMKRAELARRKAGVEIELMRAVKRALDPNGILNPGKVL